MIAFRSAIWAADVRVREDDPLADDARKTPERQGADHRRRHRELHERGRDFPRHHHGAAGVPAAADRPQDLHLRAQGRPQLPGGSAPHARSGPDSRHSRLRLRPRDPHDRHLRHGPRKEAHPQGEQARVRHGQFPAAQRAGRAGRVRAERRFQQLFGG